MKLFNQSTLGDRLREERERIKLTQEQLAKCMGVSALTTGKYELNKTSPTAEFLLQLESVGIDPLYVLTGKRQQASEALPAEVDEVLMARGILTGQGLRQDQVLISSVGLMWLLHLHERRRQQREETNLAWGYGLLQALAALDDTHMRAIHLQCIKLQGHDERQIYRQLLVYEVNTPVHSPWCLSPDLTLLQRYELDAMWSDFPVDFHAFGAESLQPVLVLKDDEHAALLRGDVLTIAPSLS